MAMTPRRARPLAHDRSTASPLKVNITHARAVAFPLPLRSRSRTHKEVDANMDDRVKDFLTYDYGEAKDLAKSFLTLVSAILVGTITFSEKIINFQTASAGQRRLTIASWSFFVLSMIICGIGLCFLFSSASMAVDCGYNNCTINYPFVGDILTPPPASG